MNSIESKMDDCGKFSFDFALFDNYCNIFWDTGVMDFIETGFVATFGEPVDGSRWRSTEIVLLDFNVIKESTGERIKLPGKEYLPNFGE